MKNKIIKLLVKLRLIKDPKRKEKRHALVGSSKRWKIKQDFQIKFLKDQGLKEDDVFLDIGCGTLRGGIPIMKFLNAGNYYGVDIRENAIEEAKNELREEKLTQKIGDLILFDKFENLQINTRFNKMLAFSVLIHLSDDILYECLKFVKNNLTDGGVLYANVNIGDNDQGSWLEFPVMFKTLDFYKSTCDKLGLKFDVLGELRELGHISGDELSDKQLMLKIYKA
jgi:SAM-dependent methyltransferase